MRKTLITLAMAAAVVLPMAGSAGATERLTFTLGVRDGLPASKVVALGQDARGFVWIGTPGGLARYDGVEVRPWARDALSSVSLLAVGPGSVVAGSPESPFFEIVGERTTSLIGPDDKPLTGISSLAFDDAGRLWVVSERRLLVRNAGGAWREVSAETFGGERPSRVKSGGETAHVLTRSGIWRMASDDAELIAALEGIERFEVLDDGTVWAAEFCCRVFEVRDGVAHQRLDVRDRSPLRAISMISRGQKVWLSYDQLLVAFDNEGGVELLDNRDGVRGGGPLLVDREQSLWLGTNLGVLRFPEPETVMWTPKDGLPRSFRHLAATGEGVWVTGWDGLGRLDPRPSRTEATRTLDLMATYPLCVDAGGRLWAGGLLEPYGPGRQMVIVERDPGRFEVHGYPKLGTNLTAFSCAPALDGSTWVTIGTLLARTSPGGGRPRVTGQLPIVASLLLHDSQDTLWVSDGYRVCQAPEAALPIGDMKCEVLERAGRVHDIHEARPGEVWIATRDAGILARRGDHWLSPFGNEPPPTPSVQSLAHAREGGVWVLSDGFVGRVEPGDKGWQVVETLGSWNGLPLLQAWSAAEDEDGTLWLATYAGVVRVPADARRAQSRAPNVELVAALVDDRRLERGSEIELPYSQNRIELRYAGLSFRDPEQLRYRVRHRPDSEWSETRATAQRFVDLAAGAYRVEVQASLDGRHWSEPASLAFTVSKPWYRQAWFITTVLLATALTFYSIYRLRLAYLLGIERERSRIAMDLHDDMGSKLGSIGILADLASADDIEEPRRRVLTERISGLAGEVGGSLADIVWALRPGSMTMQSLAAHLAERGEELLGPREIELEKEFPESWPQVRLGLGVRRHMQLIGLEALNNAARHSGASRVRLHLMPKDARKWMLRVEDDGRPDAEAGAKSGGMKSTGLGLESMRRRAELVGAELSWTLHEQGGCRVEVLFDPKAEDRRLHGKGLGKRLLPQSGDFPRGRGRGG